MILTYMAESEIKLFCAFCQTKYLSVCVCNHAQFYKLNVYFFCRIDADGHQNRWRPSSTPTNTFHEDRTPFPFVSLTALFLLCVPSRAPKPPLRHDPVDVRNDLHVDGRPPS